MAALTTLFTITSLYSCLRLFSIIVTHIYFFTNTFFHYMCPFIFSYFHSFYHSGFSLFLSFLSFYFFLFSFFLLFLSFFLSLYFILSISFFPSFSFLFVFMQQRNCPTRGYEDVRVCEESTQRCPDTTRLKHRHRTFVMGEEHIFKSLKQQHILSILNLLAVYNLSLHCVFSN